MSRSNASLDIFADMHHQPRAEYKEHCDVFIKAHLVNEAPGVGTIINYEWEVEIGEVPTKLKSETRFVDGFKLGTHTRLAG
jgi:hypothetical protein